MLDYNLSVICGPYGAGKTYYVVRNAYEEYKNGAIVISNMWLAFPHIRIYKNEDLVPILTEIDQYHRNVITPFYAPDSFMLAHDLNRNKEVPRPIYILIDEGLIFFDAREFASNLKDPKIKAMFAAPRHYDMQISVITQKITRIDKAIRELAQEYVEFTPWLFGIFRNATSYDPERFFMNEDGLNPDAPILETKKYFDWFHKKRDQSKHFGGLYFTKEVLGDLAIRHVSHIRSLKQYFLEEEKGNLHDWRENYLAKVEKYIRGNPEIPQLSFLDKYTPTFKNLFSIFRKSDIPEENPEVNLEENPHGFKKKLQ